MDIDKSKINYSMLQHTVSVHATQPAIYIFYGLSSSLH